MSSKSLKFHNTAQMYYWVIGPLQLIWYEPVGVARYLTCLYNGTESTHTHIFRAHDFKNKEVLFCLRSNTLPFGAILWQWYQFTLPHCRHVVSHTWPFLTHTRSEQNIGEQRKQISTKPCAVNFSWNLSHVSLTADVCSKCEEIPRTTNWKHV